jgi:polyisoprenoid-binding protein YceI
MKDVRQKYFVLATIVAASIAAFATSAKSVSSPDPRPVKAGTYNIDPYHSQVIFSVSHFGFTDFSGFVSGAVGTLTIDPAKPAASQLDVSVQIKSLTTSVPQLSDELKGEKWLDAANYETAKFTSTSVKVTGKDQAEITGDLTIHGITKPTILKTHFVGSGTNPLNKAFTAGFSATGRFKRSDYGITTFLPVIGDDVQLKIAGAFELKQ